MGIMVSVRNLTKLYGTAKALNGVNLEVEAGKVFALLGPNGSGKTTLMRVLTTQLPPTSGEAFVFGHDVVRESSEVRKLIGYVPQEMSIWTDISGYENLLIYAKIYGIPSGDRKELISEALKSLDLSEVADNLVKSYSGGMTRRLEIASALLIRPRILFLDEPTIGLDPSARKSVWEKLTSFKKEYNTTVFFNTHYMDEADLYSDEIGIISKGKIITVGTAGDLKRSVGGEVIVLEIENGGITEGVLNRIGDLDLVEDAIVNGPELTVVVDDVESALPNIMLLLEKEDIMIRKVSTNAPTLDDVFMKYAGTRLETGIGISEIKQTRGMIRRG